MEVVFVEQSLRPQSLSAVARRARSVLGGAVPGSLGQPRLRLLQPLLQKVVVGALPDALLRGCCTSYRWRRSLALRPGRATSRVSRPGLRVRIRTPFHPTPPAPAFHRSGLGRSRSPTTNPGSCRSVHNSGRPSRCDPSGAGRCGFGLRGGPHHRRRNSTDLASIEPAKRRSRHCAYAHPDISARGESGPRDRRQWTARSSAGARRSLALACLVFVRSRGRGAGSRSAARSRARSPSRGCGSRVRLLSSCSTAPRPGSDRWRPRAPRLGLRRQRARWLSDLGPRRGRFGAP